MTDIKKGPANECRPLFHCLQIRQLTEYVVIWNLYPIVTTTSYVSLPLT